MNALYDVIPQIEMSDAQYQERLTPVAALRFEEDWVVADGQIVELSDENRSMIFGALGAPGAYLEKLSRRAQAAVLNDHLQRGDFGAAANVIFRGSTLYMVGSGRLRAISNSDVIKGILDGVGESARSLSVARISEGGGRMTMDVVSRAKDVSVREGDVILGGLRITHDRFGPHATQMQTYLLRLVCSNGMIRRECVGRAGPRTRRLEHDHPNAGERQIGQVSRLARQLWANLEPKLHELRRLTLQSIDVHQFLTRWLLRARIGAGPATMDRLMAAWRTEGAESTPFGAVNAITRVATHDEGLTERQRRVLASLAGLVAFERLHICPRCFSLLAGDSVA